MREQGLCRKNKPKTKIPTQGALFAELITDMFKPEQNNAATPPKDDKEAEKNRDKEGT
jgi:hypothetical protein